MGLTRVMVVVVAGFAAAPACVFWDMGSWSGGPSAGDAQVADGQGSDSPLASDSRATSDASASGYASVVLKDQPLGYWRLDEPVGATVAKDSSGHGHDATATDVTFGQPGAIANDPGTSARLESAKIVVGNTFVFASNANFSLEAWIKPTLVDAIYRRIASTEAPSDPRNGYSLWVVLAPGADAGPKVGLDLLANDAKQTVAARVPAAGFVHVVVTYDGTRQVLYVNGASIDYVGTTFTLSTVAGEFVWGATDYTTATYEGCLDELAVYGAALNDAQVQAHYAAGMGR